MKRIILIKEKISRILRNANALIGLVLIAIVFFFAIFADWIAPYDPVISYPSEALQPPTFRHFMGTDDLGRDIFSRVIYGARISLGVSFTSTISAAIIGTILGVIAGYFGKIVDITVSRFNEILFSIPDILLALTIIAILGPGTDQLIVALAIAYTPIFIRLTRSIALKSRELPYVEAAKAIGEKEINIILRCILPNCVTPVLVQGTLTFAYAILAEAAFSFLALGTQPPNPSWGRMLSDARVFMLTAPWAAVFPGISIFFTSLAFNLFGDGLRDAFDVRLQT